MLKYFLGILIIQAATVAMTLAAIKSDDQELWLAVFLLAMILGLVTAFWFVSIASHAKKDALANAKDEFSREREKLRVNAKRPDLSAKVMKKSAKRPIVHMPVPASNWARVLLVLLPPAH